MNARILLGVCTLLPSGMASALPPANVILDSATHPGISKASRPTQGAALNGSFFTAVDVSGAGAVLPEWLLIQTDGTAAGTVPVTSAAGLRMQVDPYSDATTAYEPDRPSSLAVLGGHVYFRSSTPTTTLTAGELWRTDGTPAGTVLVKDIHTGTLNASNPDWLLAVGSTLYFSAYEPATGRELWKSDGSSAGTVIVRDIITGAGSGNPAPVAGFGSLCFFLHRPSALVSELWVTDGSVAGTRKFSNRTYLGGMVVNDRLIFLASDPVHGTALMATTGTTAPGVSEVVLATNLNGFHPGNNGRVYFNAAGGLWSSDGTPGGTVPVTPVSNRFTGPYFGWNGHLFGTDSFAGNGTRSQAARIPLGGGMMNAVSPVLGDYLDTVRLHQDLGSRLVFWQKPAGGSWTLHAFDGSSTVPLQAFPGSTSSNSVTQLPGLIRPLGTMGGIHFFAGPAREAGNLELWKTDGTPQGTGLVAELNASLATRTPIVSGSTPDTAWYFLPTDDGRVRPVRTAGRPGDQTRYDPLNRVDSAGEAGGKLFTASPQSAVQGAAASVAVIPVAGGPPTFLPGLSSPVILRALGTRMLFSASPDAEGPELYASDGTAAGTVRLTQFPAFPSATSNLLQLAPQDTYALGSLVLFRVTTDAAGIEFWKTDGTLAGTGLVKDIQPGAGNGIVGPQGSLAVPGLADSNAAVFGSHLYFRANDGSAGSELWRSDGSAIGTTQVKDIRPGGSSSLPDDFAATPTGLFFSANDGTNGNELWRSDGSSAGTSMVRDIRSGSSGSSINHLRALGSIVLFTADDGVHGAELWKSDGTPGGTTLVKDLRTGPVGCQPNGSWVAGGRYFLIADDGSGPTLWVSDGTPGGTMAAAESPAPGTVPSQLEGPVDGTSAHGSYLLYQTAIPTPAGIERQVRVIRPSYSGPPGWAAWLAANFPPSPSPSLAGFAADPDGDGFTNHEEYAFASDPRSMASFPQPRILPVAGSPPAEFRVSVRADAGSLQAGWSTALNGWPTSGGILFNGSAWTESSPDFTLSGSSQLGNGLWQLNLRPTGALLGSPRLFFRCGILPVIP